jgi:hypothetical protein
MTAKISNRDFAQTDAIFHVACGLANIEPTKRQASKWNRKCGVAYAWRGVATKLVTRGRVWPRRAYRLIRHMRKGGAK